MSDSGVTGGWNEYLQACSDLNAYPAKLNSSGRHEFVKSNGGRLMWIGLEDQSPSGSSDPKDYVWILDGEKIQDGSYGDKYGVYPWYSDEPDYLNYKGLLRYDGKFLDTTLTPHFGFICEYKLK